MVTDPSPAFPESALTLLMNFAYSRNAIKQEKKKTASFCSSDLYLRKAHKFSNEIHKCKPRPSPTYRSSKGQRGGTAAPSESTGSPRHLGEQLAPDGRRGSWSGGLSLAQNLLRSHTGGVTMLSESSGGGRDENKVTATSLRSTSKAEGSEGKAILQTELFSSL